MQAKLKNGKVIEVPCVLGIETPYGLDACIGVRFGKLSPEVWERWVKPILPYFQATIQEEKDGNHWVVPTMKKANLFHALVVLVRSASAVEAPQGFPLPPKDMKDPLQYLFHLYKGDRGRPCWANDPKLRKVFSNNNHGFQATEYLMSQQKIDIEKLSLAKLVEDLQQETIVRKVDANWREGNRVGLVAE